MIIYVHYLTYKNISFEYRYHKNTILLYQTVFYECVLLLLSMSMAQLNEIMAQTRKISKLTQQ